MKEGEFMNHLSRIEQYKFRVSFNSEKIDDLVMDEPEPLGSGEYPNAGKLLAAAVGNCLCSSLLFCLSKAKLEVGSMEAEVYTSLRRNEDGRLRITSIQVDISPEVEKGGRLERCLDIFQDFCIVSKSVKEGIDFKVNVDPISPGNDG